MSRQMGLAVTLSPGNDKDLMGQNSRTIKQFDLYCRKAEYWKGLCGCVTMFSRITIPDFELDDNVEEFFAAGCG